MQNKNAVISDTHTFSPTLINDLRVSLARQYFTFISASYGQGWPQKLGLPASVPQDVFPIVNFGYTAIGNGTVGARGSLNWDFTDIVTKIHGSHIMKVGYEHRLLRGNNRQSGQPSGSFTFNSNLTTDPQRTAGGRLRPCFLRSGYRATAHHRQSAWAIRDRLYQQLLCTG